MAGIANNGDLTEILFNKYEKMMYKIAYGILKSRMDAEDTVHEVFFRILKSNGLSTIAQLDPEEEKAYIIAAVRNAAYDCLNKLNRAAAENIDELLFLDSGESVEETVFAKYEAERVAEAMKKLHCKDYDILYLSYAVGLSGGEIARLYNIRESAVRQRIHRAICRLRDILKKEETANDRR